MIRQDIGDDWIPVIVAGQDSEFPRISMRQVLHVLLLPPLRHTRTL